MSLVDVVLFGASGFTGKHAAEQLAHIAIARGLTWALAGRSREKLLNVLEHISDKTGTDLSSTRILLADVTDEQSLRSMCQQARVVASCCGPYTLYGEAVVSAAIYSGTHYVDITGEPNFIMEMQLKYSEAARKAGVYVVSACAFESIPADLGVLYAQQNFHGVLNSVECYMASDIRNGSINYGTWQSLVHSIAHFNEIPALEKRLYPTSLPKFNPKLRTRLPFHKRGDDWCLPLPGSDASTVYRTQRFLHDRDGARPVQFKCYAMCGPFLRTLAIALLSVVIFVMGQFKATRNFLLEYWSSFSLGLITQGPAQEVTEKTKYTFHLFCSGWDESDVKDINRVPPTKRMRVQVSGCNPGYGMTVMGLLYSAVAILEEQHKMPPGGCVLSPGAAFGRTNLIKNLQENGVEFKIVDSKVHSD